MGNFLCSLCDCCEIERPSKYYSIDNSYKKYRCVGYGMNHESALESLNSGLLFKHGLQLIKHPGSGFHYLEIKNNKKDKSKKNNVRIYAHYFRHNYIYCCYLE